MPTLDELRRELDKDELDYPALADELGRGALEQLQTLLTEDEPRIASKATYLAALIGGPTSDDVVALAAGSRHEAVRVSAAATLDKLPSDRGTEIAQRLLSDPDVGIRARAAKSAAKVEDPRIRELLAAMAENDSHPDLRELAARLTTPL
jgi:HEAT repeat protein